MTIFLVRHAKAGVRGDWHDDDRLRPLSRSGQAQARGLIELLAGAPFERVLSSPYVRCMETVVPLASARRLAVEPDDALTEGADLEAALALVRKHMGSSAVFCSHGDVIPAILEHLTSSGVDLGADPRCPKGSTWVLEAKGGSEITRVRYLPPPPDSGE